MNGKGLGAFPASCTTAGVADLGWNLLAEDVSLPAAVLYEARVRHNLQWMQRFMEAYRVKLAPHGKTTMSPALFQRQIDGGAWGITLANAPQVQAAHNHGIRRVLMANQLVGRANMASSPASCARIRTSPISASSIRRPMPPTWAPTSANRA